MKKYLNNCLTLKNILLLLISAILLAIIAININLTKSVEIISLSDKKYILLACIAYGASTFLKSLRFKFFLNQYRLKTSEIFSVTSFHNLFNQILPFRTGELTLVYYLKKLCRTDMTSGIHLLFTVRLMDIVMVGTFFIISLFLNTGFAIPNYMLTSAIALLLLSFIAVMNLHRIIRFFIYISLKILKGISIISEKKKSAMTDKLNEIYGAMGERDIISKMLSLFITSFLVWTALYIFSYCVIKSFNADIRIFQSVLGSTAAVLTNVLPINSFGSLGTLEAGWVGGYLLVGIDKNSAIISAFTYHIINIIIAAMLALLSKLFFLRRKEYEADNSDSML